MRTTLDPGEELIRSDKATAVVNLVTRFAPPETQNYIGDLYLTNTKLFLENAESIWTLPLKNIKSVNAKGFFNKKLLLDTTFGPAEIQVPSPKGWQSAIKSIT